MLHLVVMGKVQLLLNLLHVYLFFSVEEDGKNKKGIYYYIATDSNESQKVARKTFGDAGYLPDGILFWKSTLCKMFLIFKISKPQPYITGKIPSQKRC